jgi:hypothetical protein
MASVNRHYRRAPVQRNFSTRQHRASSADLADHRPSLAIASYLLTDSLFEEYINSSTGDYAIVRWWATAFLAGSFRRWPNNINRILN